MATCVNAILLLSSVITLYSLQTFASGNFEAVRKDLFIRKVDRTIDLSSQLVKITSKLVVENTGSNAAPFFIFTLGQETRHHVSIVEALDKEASETKRHLLVKASAIQERPNDVVYRINFATPLQSGKSRTVEVEVVLTHHQIPFPTHINQNDKQLVRFTGNVYFYSPYSVDSQITLVKLSSANLESYTKQKPVAHSNNEITYGPYESQQPFAQSEMIIHCENNNPFLTVTRLERLIEVSHWGNIAIQEDVDIKHTGAILKGAFSRYDYQREQNGISSIKAFKTLLPASAADVYYRDEIGNVSTSHMRVSDDAVELDIRPRFPLFGGWKTRYILGYNLPSYEYLFNRGSDYILRIRLIDHIFDDMVVDHAQIKIVLPEGSKVTDLQTAFPVKRQKDELHYTYLDSTGRPVVVMEVENCVENHIQEFNLHYQFDRLYMFQEPLLLIVAFYLIFFLIIIYVRTDFSITKDDQSDTKLRSGAVSSQIQRLQDRRAAIYEQYLQAIQTFKTNKDLPTFQATLKKLNAAYKIETQAITEAHDKMKADMGKDAVEKIAELQRADKVIKEQLSQLIAQVEKFVSGKIGKQNYLEFEHQFIKKKDEAADCINGIIAHI